MGERLSKTGVCFFLRPDTDAIWKIFFKKAEQVPARVLICANIIAALLFAAGHLPATVQMFGEITPLLL